MGICLSALDRRAKARAAKARSDAIDLQIEEDSRKLKKEVNILVLGASFPLCALLWPCQINIPLCRL
jgi:hypothetical protein